LARALLLGSLGLLLIAHWVGWLLVARRSTTRASRWLALVPGAGPFLGSPGLSPARSAAAVLAAMVAAYLSVAVVSMSSLLIGGERTNYPKVHEVAPGSAADGVLVRGDVILAVDGQPVRLGPDEGLPTLPERVAASHGASMKLTVERGGARVTATATPRLDPETGRHRLGVTLAQHVVSEPRSLVSAVADGLAAPGRVFAAIIRGYAAVWSADEVVAFAGPVALTKMIDDAVAESAWELVASVAAYALLLLLLLDVLVLVVIGILGASARWRRRPAA
jgi:hypothetical protein